MEKKNKVGRSYRKGKTNVLSRKQKKRRNKVLKTREDVPNILKKKRPKCRHRFLFHECQTKLPSAIQRGGGVEDR